jgi:methionyl-tRNA synthetase
MAKVVVCVAWPYSNSPIHLGHVAGSLLPPDIFAKYHRLKGDEVLMVSGSDQHGTPVTVKAEKENVSPEEIAERYHNINSKAIKDLHIDFSLFTKTHTQNHFEVVHDVFLRLLDNGYLYKKETLQYHCPRCQRFLPDRYVEGKCKNCGNERARGDQCDSCGTTFSAGELEAAICTLCGSSPELKDTEHYFLRLSAFQERLLDYVRDKSYWKANVQTFTRNWLEAGLADRAITRDMTWGVSVPLPGWEDKVIYVWFEAVIGYLSASIEWAKRSGDREAWMPFWTDPEVRHYYFLGKDNIPFHTIIWPAILMGYGGLNLPYDVPANEFLTFKGEKFSKSRGVGVDIPSLLQDYDSDIIRYYLATEMPENRDAEFSWEEFEVKINNELVATLGNYYHRVLSFTHRNFGNVPEFRSTEENRREVTDAIRTAMSHVDEHLSICQFKKALKSVMDLAQFGNRYFDSVAPWALVKNDRDKCGSVLNLSLEIVKSLAVLSYPFIPRSAEDVWKLLGYEASILDKGWEWIPTPISAGQILQEPRPLFSRVVIAKGDRMFSEFEKLSLKVGTIQSVSDHPNADKLLVMDVDIGRRIKLVAGLRGHYLKDKLIGKKIVVVTNLQPARLRGVESQGMLLAAEHGEKVILLTPSSDAPAGESIDCGMKPSEKVLTFPEFQKLSMLVGRMAGQDSVDIGRIVRSKGPCVVPEVGKTVAVFLPSAEACDALVLCTKNGVPITVDGDIESGAPIR